MDQQLVSDLDDFVGAFEEFICIVGEQTKNQPCLQLNGIAVVLNKQLADINRRAQALYLAVRSERSDLRTAESNGHA